MTPQRREISCFSAARVTGSGALAIGGTLIHGAPFLVVIFTPPVVCLRSAVFSRSNAAVCLVCKPVMNARASRGLDRAR